MLGLYARQLQEGELLLRGRNRSRTSNCLQLIIANPKMRLSGNFVDFEIFVLMQFLPCWPGCILFALSRWNFSKGLSFVVGDTHFEAHSLSTLCLLSFVFPVTGALWRCSVHFTWLPEGFSVQVSILRVCVFCIYQCNFCVCMYLYLYHMQSVF